MSHTTSFKKKLTQSALVVMLTLAGSGMAVLSVQASSTPKTPSIQSVTDKSKNSVTLPITDTDLKGKKVKVTIEITNKSSDSVSKKTKTITLDSNGQGTVKISNLDSDTKYSFRVLVKEDKSGSKESKYSKSKTVTTDKK